MTMTTADLVMELRGQKLSNIGVVGINSIAMDANPALNGLNVLYITKVEKLLLSQSSRSLQCPNPVGSGTCVFWDN